MCRNLARNLAIASLCSLFVVTSAPASEIRDDAGFFSPQAVKQARSLLTRLQQDTGKEVDIETFQTVPDGQADEVSRMSAAERERYFENWARSRATSEHAKGIFILITRHPGHVQIETDRQTRNQGFGTTERNQVRDQLRTGFQHKNYDQALLNAVDEIDRTIRAKVPQRGGAQNAPAAVPHGGPRNVERIPAAPAPRPQAGRGLGWIGWVGLILVILLGVRLISAFFERRAGGLNRPSGGGYGGGGGSGGYGAPPSAGGGGMLGGLMSGMLGGFAGNWLYSSLFGSHAHAGPATGFDRRTEAEERGAAPGAGQDFQGSGGDFDDSDTNSGTGAGGDVGDAGAGDFGAGDFGNGDAGGGGDFGGDNSGGGDSGGGDF